MIRRGRLSVAQSNILKCIQAATTHSNMLNLTNIHMCLLRERSRDRGLTVPYTCIAAFETI